LTDDASDHVARAVCFKCQPLVEWWKNLRIFSRLRFLHSLFETEKSYCCWPAVYQHRTSRKWH